MDNVPPGILRGANKMQEVQYFKPNLNGPATNQTPFTSDDHEDKAGDAEGENLSETDTTQHETNSGCCRTPNALIA